MATQQTLGKNHFFLLDHDLIDRVDLDCFDPAYYARQQHLVGEAQGRGTTHFIRMNLTTNEQECVLRHYRRGGFIARFNKDHYQWTGLKNTRAWREWHLLRDMVQLGLPVPKPVAAHVQRAGLFYSADIITIRIPAAETLAQLLQQSELSNAAWINIGATIKRFHQAGIYHSDLNAHNILLSASGECFVIDFDKGEQRQPDKQWQQANLDRLLRSLEKLKGRSKSFRFDNSRWQALLSGYGVD